MKKTEQALALVLGQEEEKTVVFRDVVARRRRFGTRALIVVILLLGVMVALVVDLLHAKPSKDSKVHQIQVDLSKTLPEVHADFSLDIESRWSDIRLTSVTCELESGKILTNIFRDGRTANYHVDVSIPQEDAESHARFIRHFMFDNKSLDYLVCTIGVKVLFGYVIPFRHTVRLTQEDLKKQGLDTEVSSMPLEVQSRNTDILNATSGIERLPIMTQSNGALHLTLTVPKHTALDRIRLTTPPLSMSVETCNDRKSVVDVDGLDDVELAQLDFFRVQLGCVVTNKDTTSLCTWYNPLVDVFTGGNCALVVSIESSPQGSFLELLLGRHHELDLIKRQKKIGNIGRNRRKLVKGLPTLGEVFADCIRISGEELNAEICTTMLLSEGVQATANMNFHSLMLKSEAAVDWESPEESAGIKIEGTAKGEINGEDQFNANGALTMNFDDLSFNASLLNEMDSWPITFDLNSHAVLEDGLFSLILDNAFLRVRSNIIMHSSGNLELNLDEQTFLATVEDPNLHLDMRATLLEDNVLTGSFDLTADGEILTATQMMARVDTNDNSSSIVAEVKDVVAQDFIFYTAAQVNSTDSLLAATINDLSLQVSQESYITTTAGFELSLDEKTVRVAMTMSDLANLETFLQAQLDGEALGGYYSVALDDKNKTYGKIDATIDITEDEFRFSGAVQDNIVQDYSLSGNTTLSWTDSLTLSLPSLVFQVNKRKYIDANGRFALDLDNSAFVLFAQDFSDRVDYFYTGIRGNWFSGANTFAGQVDEFTIAVASDIFINSTGDLLVESSEDETSEQLLVSLKIDSDPNANLELNTTLDVAWDFDANTLTTNLWKMDIALLDEQLMQAVGDVSVIGDTASLLLVDEIDTDGQGFNLSASVSWPDDIITGNFTADLVTEKNAVSKAFGVLTMDFLEELMSCDLVKSASNGAGFDLNISLSWPDALVESKVLMKGVDDNVTNMDFVGGMLFDLAGKSMSCQLTEFQSESHLKLEKGAILIDRSLLGSLETFEVDVEDAAVTFKGDKWLDGNAGFLLSMNQSSATISVENNSTLLFVDAEMTVHFGDTIYERCAPYNDALGACFEAHSTDKGLECQDCLLAPLASKVGQGRVCSNLQSCESTCGGCIENVKTLADCAWKCSTALSFNADPPSPSEQTNQSSNIFNKPTVEGDAPKVPFEQTIAVTLKGLTQLLNEAEQEEFVKATQSFLRAQGDETVIVEFVSQRLSKRFQGFHRDLLVREVVVDTNIVSWEDETPGETALDLITAPENTFVDALQKQDGGSFAAVENIEVVLLSESNPPSTSPEDASTDDPSGDKQTIVVVAAVVIPVFILLGFAIFCYIRRVRRMITDAKASLSDSDGWSDEGNGVFEAADGVRNGEDWSDKEPEGWSEE